MLKKILEERETLRKYFMIVAEDPTGAKIDEWNRAVSLSKILGCLWILPLVFFISSFYLFIRLLEVLIDRNGV